MPQISVITPCYNTGPYIWELADCLANQTNKEFEWIIADDGSSEPTRRILEDIEQRKDLDVRILYNEHQGGNFCRNTGFNSSSSEYVKFLDADDLIDESLLEHQLQTAHLNPKSMVVSPTVILRKNGLFVRETSKKLITANPLEQYLRNPQFMHGGCLIPRQAVDEIAGWDESLSVGQDLDFFRRLLLVSSPSLVWEDRSAFYYRQHDQSPRVSQPTKNIRAKYEGQLEALDKFSALLREHGRFEEFSPLLAQNYDRWATSAAVSCPEMCEPLLIRARSVASTYPLSGGPVYRLLRRAFGIRWSAHMVRMPLLQKTYESVRKRGPK